MSKSKVTIPAFGQHWQRVIVRVSGVPVAEILKRTARHNWGGRMPASYTLFPYPNGSALGLKQVKDKLTPIKRYINATLGEKQ